MNQWITATELKTLQPEINSATPDATLNKHILNAQLLDLRPFLGERMYVDIDSNIGAPDTELTNIMNAKTYTYSGYTYSHSGIKEVLAHYAYARIVHFGNTKSTPFGMVVKQQQQSREASFDERMQIYDENRQIAFHEWEMIASYMQRNISDYPLWNCTTGPDFNISKISKKIR